MKYNIKFLLFCVATASCVFAYYAAMSRPVILKLGMPQDRVILALNLVDAHDLVASKRKELVHVIPTKDATIGKDGLPTHLMLPPTLVFDSLDPGYAITVNPNDLTSLYEHKRRKAVLLQENESNKFWLVPYHGTVEFHFADGKLRKMVQWDGNENTFLRSVKLKKLNGQILLTKDLR